MAAEAHRASTRARPLALVLVVALAAVALATGVVVARSVADGADSVPAMPPQSAFQDRTGVRVTRVAVTAAGGMVDLRYQVIDPVKAEAVHLYQPTLVDETTGAVISGLFMGHSHSGEPKAGYTYPLLFVNEAGVIERGGVVAVVIGDARLEHVPVR